MVNGADENWPEQVFAQISESHCGRTVRTKRWKYAVAATEASAGDLYDEVYREAFLYDLDEDPFERNNLVADPRHADIRTDMAARLKRCMADAEEPPATILPAENRGESKGD